MLLENEPYPQDVRVRSEAEALAGSGHQVTVYAPRSPGQPRREVVGRVRVRRYWLPPAREDVGGFLLEYGAAHVQLLIGALRELVRDVEVVHLHNPPDTLFPIGRAARLLRRSVVFDLHDLFPELVEAKFGRGPLWRLAAWAERRALRSAHAVIVTNESQREAALARGKLEPDAVTVVRNGPPRAVLSARPRRREGTLSSPRLVYLGALGPQDGVLELPSLLARPGLRNARLTVVGDGPCRAAIEARTARDPALSGRVDLLGRVEHARVPGLLAEADIAVDPAPCNVFNHRSTMTKIAEYLAAGLPVVAYDLLETRRTAGDAVLYARCGEPLDFAAKVVLLAGDPGLRGRLGDRGRRRAEALVWERSEEALLAVYRGLRRRGRVATRPPAAPRRSPSTAELPLPAKLRQNAELLADHFARRRARPLAPSLLEEIAEYELLLRQHGQPPLRQARVFEIGYGARPYRLLALRSMGVDAIGVDAEVPVLHGRPVEYWRVLRTNGPERALKTLLRRALFDRRERRALEEELARRGLRARLEDDRLLVDDAANVGLKPASVDLIISEDVFEHVSRPSLERLVDKMAIWLRPGGLALIRPNVFTGIIGGHALEWERRLLRGESMTCRTMPWGHLRGDAHRPNTFLNRLTRGDYRALFERRFEILGEFVKYPGLGRELLTPEVRADLAGWSDDELFSNQVLFVLRPREQRGDRGRPRD